MNTPRSPYTHTDADTMRDRFDFSIPLVRTNRIPVQPLSLLLTLTHARTHAARLPIGTYSMSWQKQQLCRLLMSLIENDNNLLCE